MVFRKSKLFKDKFPLIYSIFNKIRRDFYLYRIRKKSGGDDAREIFGYYLKRNLFGDPESKSGTGSSLEATKTIREKIPPLLKRIGAKTILDIPCGDFYWTKEIDWSGFEYLGAEVLPELVEQNQKRYGSKNIQFVELDVLKDEMPRKDIILCRDLLIHFSNSDVKRAVNAFKKSGSRYLLMTHFTSVRRNKDIRMGSFRPINLVIEPFRFPSPEFLIPDDDYIKLWGRTLALWRLDLLPSFDKTQSPK